MNKLFFIKHISTLLIRNKLRSLLLIIGLFLTALVYPCLDIISTNLVAKAYTYYQNFPNNALYIKAGNISENDINNMKLIDKDFSYSTMVSSFLPSRIKDFQSDDIDISLNFFYAQPNFENFPIPSFDIYNSIEKTEIIAGRSFSINDIMLNKKVAVIHDSTAKLLFKNQKNVIGKKINLNSRQDYFSELGGSIQDEIFTIIGVLKDTPDILRIFNDYNKSGKIEVPFFAPKINNISDNTLILITRGPIDETYEKDMLSTLDSSYQVVYGFSRYSIVKELEEQISLIKKSNSMIIIIVYSVCMIFLTTILLFFVKERIIEIGIRKAVGASEKDIFIQFVLEITSLGFVCSILGTLFGALIGSLVSFIITASFGTPSCILHISSFLLPVLFVILISLLSSIVPSIIASKKSVKECLQFE